MHSNGAIEDKAKQMSTIAACGMESLNARVLKTRLYGNTTAVVLGTLAGKTKGGKFTFDVFYTRVYIRQKDGWRLVSHQSTDRPRS